MASKPKSALSKSSSTKTTPAASRVSNLDRGVVRSNNDVSSRVPSTRLSVSPIPSSNTPKPTPDRRFSKLGTPPDNTMARVSKSSDRQAELNLAQDDLKKTKEKLVLAENEKAKALVELKEAQNLTEELAEKLREALIAQKRAEENSEIDKFRAVEMEQAGVETVQKKEEEWQKELEFVKNQHSVDAATLLSTTQELQKVKEEIAKTCDAKNLALSRAEDATKLAETHAEKVESLTAELLHMTNKFDSKLEIEAGEKNKLVSELNSEILYLKKELVKAKSFEEKLSEKEVYLEQLNVDFEAAKLAESYAHNLLDELNTRIDELTDQADQAKRLERSAADSLGSIIKQLEGSNDALHDAETEIASLKEKMGLLEISIARHKVDREGSEHLLKLAREETCRMVSTIESLMSDIESLKDEKVQALNHEQLAAASLQSLLEEKNKLMNELDIARDEEENSKKALESMASALHEVSLEARDAKEKLLSLQVEHENYETQIKDLNLAMKTTNDKYENAIDDAKQEIDALSNSMKESEHDWRESKVEWEQKELHLMTSVKKSEEERSHMESEISRLVNLIKMTEEEACALREEEDRWKKSFKDAESEVISSKEMLSKAEAENVELKRDLMDRENELQNILQENELLQDREASSLKKVEELSKLLDEALSKKQGEQTIELTDSEKDYDMLPKVVEFSEQNGKGHVKPMLEVQPQHREKEIISEVTEVIDNKPVQKDFYKDNINQKSKEFSYNARVHDESADIDPKMWESCKIEVQDYSPEGEAEQESFDDELESKADSSDGLEQANGLSSTENLDTGACSPPKQQSHKKKKKPLLQKFGNLLKKKGTTNQK